MDYDRSLAQTISLWSTTIPHHLVPCSQAVTHQCFVYYAEPPHTENQGGSAVSLQFSPICAFLISTSSVPNAFVGNGVTVPLSSQTF